jgi:hypothetical protein
MLEATARRRSGKDGMITEQRAEEATVTRPACAHDHHSNLGRAIDAIGYMVVHGSRLAEQLNHSNACRGDAWPWDAFQPYVALRALYTTERALIEFILPRESRRPDDVWPGCFLSKDCATFPFGAGSSAEIDDLAEELKGRRDNADKQIAHLTWQAIETPRSWTYGKSENILKGLELFTGALQAESSPYAARLLAKMAVARRKVWEQVRAE